jgi:FtsP/CotA-like multicopper oxidase with cupredoxin domain
MRNHSLYSPSITLKAGRWLLALTMALALALTGFSPAQALGPCGSPTQLIDLWAKSGTFTLPDSSSVTIWGYSLTAGDPAQLPGPQLTVAEGTCVQVTLHNDLAEATSLALHGQGLPADTTGAGASGTAVYTFSATRPGTYLYEAGLTNNGARQVAMGLYGALIVQPATAPTTHSSEAVLVLSEIDPALNAAPTTFDMGDYHPRFWLVNGQAYPSIPTIPVPTGSTALLRYINAGLNENSMGLLGVDQEVVAADGYALPNTYRVVAETLPPGGTLDTLVSVTGAESTQYPLYSTAQRLDNNGTSYGGQLLSITATAAAPVAPLPSDVPAPKPSELPAQDSPDVLVPDPSIAPAPKPAEGTPIDIVRPEANDAPAVQPAQ